MGTNFYVRGLPHSTIEAHIGKRSAAGLYCWDCNRTLCAEPTLVHVSLAEWFEACPQCGNKPAVESLDTSSAGRELGFNKSAPTAKTGVRSCSSFAWQMTPEQFASFVNKGSPKCCSCNRAFDDGGKIIEDEYGRLYTSEEFAAVLDECPIQDHDMVGEYFR